MPQDKHRTIQSRRHTPWQENPSEEWTFALDHMDRGEWESAVTHCRKAIEIWPTYYDAWLLLGGALEEQGEHDDALGAVERASEIAISELSQAWNNLASLRLIRQEWEAALTIDRVLDVIDPTRRPLIRYRMAVAYTGMGDLDRALRLLLEGIDARPELLNRALEEPWLAPLHDRLRALQPGLPDEDVPPAATA